MTEELFHSVHTAKIRLHTYISISQSPFRFPAHILKATEEMNTITVEIKNYVTRQLADIILHAVDEEDFNARMQELTDQR